uniref:Reverse transcriptase zinc-binding domain-containing protein n=1 Tax=Micrurus paraensis TaxID=1970185 RepID=A0A2D4KBR9_9SAUR
MELEEEIVKEPMIAWAKNIGHSIELDDWENYKNYKLILSTAYKENQYKMFYRWHLVLARLAEMYPNTKSECWKCKRKDEMFFHMWWQCPKARKCWAKVQRWLQEITEHQIEFKPKLFLLGIIKGKLSKQIQYIILHIITAARVVFPQSWKLENIASEEMLIQKILECAEMDKLTI